ncbi:MAG: DUF58 domain-containing protein [Niastella sp.]|nr:DUF58 domain-containing protein [Niastella sp.]
MTIIKKYIGDLYIGNRFYWAAGGCIALFILAFYFPGLYEPVKVVLYTFIVLILVDYVFLFFIGKRPVADRQLPDRFSNGDENPVKLFVQNKNNFGVRITIIDELPFQFQKRDFEIDQYFAPIKSHWINYALRPVSRGEYEFGNINLFMRSMLGLLEQRTQIQTNAKVKVYPSFVQLGNYQLLASTHVVAETGNKRMNKIGQSMEFEQIKDYVPGDDIRTINWKATARKGGLMVNKYVDEKSQQLFCIIDKGRLMKMPFDELSLLDHAINSVLALSQVCIKKQDKIGLLSFSNQMGTILAADRKPIQRENIMMALYNEKTDFKEPDFELLYTRVRHKIKQRSLLILYTNFESVSGLKRQLPYLRSIARHHLLLVIIFENSELKKLSQANAENIDDVYVKAIAEKLVFEKKLIVKELQKYGINTLLSTPENVTVNAINKYLEIKGRQIL